MFDYLQQFNNLPKELRTKVSSPEVMSAITELEKKYQVDLAVLVMKVMIKSLSLANLSTYFVSEWQLEKDSAENLVKELSSRIFNQFPEHLSITPAKSEVNTDEELQLIIKEAGIVVPSSDLLNRFKVILSTYLKGVRSRVATRDALAKEINFGGLNFSDLEIDRILKACDRHDLSGLKENIKKEVSTNRLNQLIGQETVVQPSAEYDLKKSLALGEIKKPAEKLEAPDKSLKIEAPEETKSLEAPESNKRLEVPILPTSEISEKEKLVIDPQAAAVAENIISRQFQPKPTSAAVVSDKKSVVLEKKVEENIKPVSIKTPEAPKILITPTPPPSSRPQAVATARSLKQSSETTSRPLMHDVKPLTQVMGPIEELQFLDLLNFRRLGKKPAEISAKIFNKIKLLEADGYEKMIAGVRAWRQSPVNRLYLKMMKEAINKGVTIKDFAASLKDGDKYLNLEEIEEIIKMNSRLVF